MKHLFIFLVVGGLTSLLSGCDDGANKKKAESAVAPGPASSLLILGIQREAIANRYRVSLRWPHADAGKFALVVSRESRHDGLVHLATLHPEQITYEDLNVAAGEHYTYFLSRQLPSSLERIAQEEIVVPQDVVIEGKRALPALPKVARLFLRKGSELHLNGARAEINVEEIHSDGAILRSFPVESRAAQGNPGAPAQPIILRAERGSGQLRIEANGQMGGVGLKGVTGAAGKAGAAGENAQLKYSETFGNDALRPFLLPLIEEITRGLPPQDPKWRDVFACAKPPANGAPGESGLPGGMGLQGGRGGSTPFVYVRIQNPQSFEVEVVTLPGSGGTAGEGGDGGAGGKGGAAGARDEHHICPAAEAGADGPVGKRGEPAPMSDLTNAGEISPYCLELGDARFGHCEAVRRELLISK